VALREPWRHPIVVQKWRKTLSLSTMRWVTGTGWYFKARLASPSRSIEKQLPRWHPAHHWRLRLKRETVVDVWWYRLVGQPVTPSPVVRKARQRWGCCAPSLHRVRAITRGSLPDPLHRAAAKAQGYRGSQGSVVRNAVGIGARPGAGAYAGVSKGAV
jgi:hypothetical protein